MSTTDEKERAIQAFWEENDIFQKSLQPKHPRSFFQKIRRTLFSIRPFIFFDGPPFATGLPHYGHILSGTIKDVIPRYRTMRGFLVPRRWGWDCHGLPLEVIAEKEIGISGREAIEKYGIAVFNNHIRNTVLRYEKEWKRIIPRLGRFVDMESPYKTMDPSYTESVWSVFARLHAGGLAYRGFNSVHLCPRCETVLSNHEVSLGFGTKKDIAVFATLPLKNEKNTSLVIWTTTPWTLPANTAAAVHKDISYCFIKKDGHRYIVSAKQKSIIDGEVEKTVPGKDLVGLEYEPFFSYYENKRKEGAFFVHHADFVDGEGGTGVVHLAPAFGAEDLDFARKQDIPIVNNIGYNGAYDKTVSDLSGWVVRSLSAPQGVDGKIIEMLRARGRVVDTEEIEHEYPFCWRCKTPLINYAAHSWFVAVSRFRAGLSRANRRVRWIPDHLRDGRFGTWLSGAQDWAVSRNRFWGAPLPVWSNGNNHIVIDSLKTMKRYLPKPRNDIVCVRHCFAYSNRDAIANGDWKKDRGLTETGVSQARALGEKIGSADIIYTSPMPRALQTAEHIAKHLGIPKEHIVPDERLTEARFGSREGASFADPSVVINTSQTHTFSTAVSNAESRDSVSRRVISFIYDIDKKHKDRRVLIVSHKQPLQLLLSHGAGVIFEPTDTHSKLKERGVPVQGHTTVYPLSFQPFPVDETHRINFHRPYIDAVVLYNTHGTAHTHCGEVFDCWFESGAMPYGAHHLLFSPTGGTSVKQKETRADFIAEGLDQTRGWFYSLLVLGYGCFGRSPYKTVIVNGMVLAGDGKKMSKSEKNFTDPMDLVQKSGADAIRFFLMRSSATKGESLFLSDDGVEEQKQKVIDRLYNSLRFYTISTEAAEGHVEDSPHSRADGATLLERWMDVRIAETRGIMTEALDAYDIQHAACTFADVVEDLSLWYVRRQRSMVRGPQGAPHRRHLKKTLYLIAHLGAPLVPFVSEYIYRALRTKAEVESVHLVRWPAARPVDTTVLKTMAIARDIIKKALQARVKHSIRVRQPLQTLYVPCEMFDGNEEVIHHIKEEVNVRSVRPEKFPEVTLDTTITPDLQKDGFVRELMRGIQNARRKIGSTPGETVMVTAYTTVDITKEKQMIEQKTASVLSVHGSDYTGNDGTEVRAGDLHAVFTVA